MKIKTRNFLALSLILSLLLTGAFALGTTSTANVNGVLLSAHDGPSDSRGTI